MVVENLFHRKTPSAQRNSHQNPQGMNENHHENITLSHPWGFGTYL
jgi:hypothetical protein